MDKYEMNLKIDQIKKLASKKAYKEAAALAREMNWMKVKDWSILATVINVQEAVGDYEEARDMAIIAYNRNLGGRKLVYKLTQLMIKLGQFEEADELYDEYDRMSPHDANRYVLFYELRKAEGASDSELIGILEEYKELEADEKYLYSLASLYAKMGRKDDCIKTCDDIILWFQDGTFVENALQLKKEQGANLTTMQKKIQADAASRKQDLGATKEILFKQQQELAKIQKDELEEFLNESEAGVKIPENEPKTVNVSNAVNSVDLRQQEHHTEAIEIFAEADDVQDDEPENIHDFALNMQDSQTEEETGEIVDIEDADDGEESSWEAVEETEAESDVEAKDTSKISSQIPDNIRELIANAKKKIDSNYDRMSKEDEAERLEEEAKEALRKLDARNEAIAEQVVVPSYSIFDTQNFQEEIAKNLSEYLDEEDEFANLRPGGAAGEKDSVSGTSEASEVSGDSDAAESNSEKISQSADVSSQAEDDVNPEEEQIEGQLNLADWLESVREEKYGKQNTKEYSRRELERILDEKEEKSAAYERLIAEQRAKAMEQGQEPDEAELRIKARTQMMLHAAKTDLAIRTGKATLKLEEAVENLKEAAEVAKQIEQRKKEEEKAAAIEAAQRAAAEKETAAREAAQREAAAREAEKERAAREAAQREAMAIEAARQQEAAAREAAQRAAAEKEIAAREAAQREAMAIEAKRRQEAAQREAAAREAERLRVMREAAAVEAARRAAEESAVSANGADNSTEVIDADSVAPVQEDIPAQTEYTATVEQPNIINLETARFEPVTDEVIQANNAAATMNGDDEGADIFAKKQTEVKIKNPAVKGQIVVRDGEKRLTGDLAKLFRKYREMPGIENQLVEYFDSIDAEMKMNTSRSGNLIISGNSSSDKIDLARTIVRAINFLYPNNTKKIAKTTGDSINSRGIEKAMPKLLGTALIVEGAGVIEPKRMDELMRCLEQDTSRMIVIFEDADSEMNVLINFNPEITEKFNHRIVLKQYTVNELVEIARKFARKKMYEVDEDALLELYLRVDKLHNTTDNIKLDDIKEIVNGAIEKSEIRASKKLFGGFRKKLTGGGDIKFLTAADFKE